MAKWRRRPAARPHFVADTSGVVYVELLISILPVFTMWLGIAQLALLGQASLAVRHSANAAARSAVVVLDDDPRGYGDTPRRRLDTSGRGGGGSTGFLDALGGSLGIARRGDARTRDIRLAAYVPLIGIAPSSGQIFSRAQSRSLRAAVGTSSLSRAAFGALYVMSATGVTFHGGMPGSMLPWSGNEHQTRFAPGSAVTVRVTHAFPCLVPIASRFLCDTWIELQTGVPITGLQDLIARIRQGTSTVEDLRAIMRAQEQMREQRRRLDDSSDELEALGEAEIPGTMWLTAANGTRFRLLSARATLPLQSAPYPYQSEVR